jgi:hypothetical protein
MELYIRSLMVLAGVHRRSRKENINSTSSLDARLTSPFDRTTAMANLLESELASCVGISERWWYDEIYSRCCEDIERDDEKIGNLSQDRFERWQPSQPRLKEHFDTTYFLCLGLRLFGAPHEFKNHCIYEIITDGKATLSPHWTKWPWEVRDGTPHSSCWSNDSLMANFIMHDYYVQEYVPSQTDSTGWKSL